MTAVLALLLSAGTAGANDSIDRAQEIYAEGRELAAQDRLDEAIARFEEAWRLARPAAALYSIGVCYERLGDLPRAIGYFERYVEAESDAGERREVVTLLQRLRSRPAVLTIGSSPNDAAVFVDDESRSRGRTPLQALELSPGPHRVTVRLAAHEPTGEAVEVGPGERRSMFLSLDRSDGARVDESVRAEPLAATPIGAWLVVGLATGSVGPKAVPPTAAAAVGAAMSVRGPLGAGLELGLTGVESPDGSGHHDYMGTAFALASLRLGLGSRFAVDVRAGPGLWALLGAGRDDPLAGRPGRPDGALGFFAVHGAVSARVALGDAIGIDVGPSIDWAANRGGLLKGSPLLVALRAGVSGSL